MWATLHNLLRASNPIISSYWPLNSVDNRIRVFMWSFLFFNEHTNIKNTLNVLYVQEQNTEHILSHILIGCTMTGA